MPESWKGENTCIHVCNHFFYSIFCTSYGLTNLVALVLMFAFQSYLRIVPLADIWTTSSWFHMPIGHPLMCFKHVSQAHGLNSFLSKPNLYSGARWPPQFQNKRESCVNIFFTLSMCFLHEYGPSVSRRACYSLVGCRNRHCVRTSINILPCRVPPKFNIQWGFSNMVSQIHSVTSTNRPNTNVVAYNKISRSACDDETQNLHVLGQNTWRIGFVTFSRRFGGSAGNNFCSEVSFP